MRQMVLVDSGFSPGILERYFVFSAFCFGLYFFMYNIIVAQHIKMKRHAMISSLETSADAIKKKSAFWLAVVLC